MIITPSSYLRTREFSVDKLIRGRNYTINVEVNSKGVKTTHSIPVTTPLRGGKRKTRKIKKSRKSRKSKR